MADPLEHPILFSGPMVRAILDGRKTVTRRIVKPTPVNVASVRQLSDIVWSAAPTRLGEPIAFNAPRWKRGDSLWVRETWARNPDMPPGTRHAAVYQADLGRFDKRKWTPSIHMPRWASRITLEVTDVRCQRLQDIREEDAVAEGAFKGKATGRVFNNTIEMHLGGPQWANARDWYADLWDHINGPGSWGANPWVWAISFRRIER